jgi:type IV secretion system protein VirD4
MKAVKFTAAAAAVLATPYLWLVAATAMYCLLNQVVPHAGLHVGAPWDPFVFPYVQWIEAFPYWKSTFRMTFLVWGSTVIPTMVLLVVGRAAARSLNRRLANPLWGGPRAQERGVTTNHGDSRWATVADMKRMFPGPHPVYGGTVVGEAYRVDEDRVAKRHAFDPRNRRTWGKGGKAPLLTDPCVTGPTHCVTIAGSGWYKSQVAATQIMAWTGSKVILDPSCELGPMTEDALKARGERVFQVKMADRSGMDAIDWIDINHDEAEMHVAAVVSAVYNEEAVQKNSDPLFTPMGRNLVTCLLASLLWDSDPGVKPTLSMLGEAMSTPEDEMPALLQAIYANTKSKLARRLAGTAMKMRADETFSGVYVNAVTGTSWLSTTVYADLVSDGVCTPDSILSDDGPTTIFLQIPLSALENTPGIARVLVSSLFNRVVLEDGKVPGRILFMLDEAARLGRMPIMEVIRDAGRKYGITMMLLYQSISQMTDQWGTGALDKWQQSTSWFSYAAISSQQALMDVSKACGSHSVLAYSEGFNAGRQSNPGRWGSKSRGSTTNVHEISRPLITPDELRLMRADEAVVIPAGGLPMRCGRAIWFRRAELQRLLKTSRFAR